MNASHLLSEVPPHLSTVFKMASLQRRLKYVQQDLVEMGFTLEEQRDIETLEFEYRLYREGVKVHSITVEANAFKRPVECLKSLLEQLSGIRDKEQQ